MFNPSHPDLQNTWPICLFWGKHCYCNATWIIMYVQSSVFFLYAFCVSICKGYCFLWTAIVESYTQSPLTQTGYLHWMHPLCTTVYNAHSPLSITRGYCMSSSLCIFPLPFFFKFPSKYLTRCIILVWPLPLSTAVTHSGLGMACTTDPTGLVMSLAF